MSATILRLPRQTISDEELDGREVIHPFTPLFETAFEIDIDVLVGEHLTSIVRPFLTPGCFAVLYSDSGSGKSFVAMDMAWHVALGKQWAGRPVTKGPVLYVALEGTGGFRRRMKAYAQEHGDPGQWFARLKLSPRLAKKDSPEGLKAIVQAVEEQSKRCEMPTSLIVLDTLARAVAGDDENSAGDISHFVERRAGALQRATGAAVLVLHHANKVGAIRGSTALFAAADLVMAVEKTGHSRRLIAEKVKDGTEGTLLDFQIEDRILYSGLEDGVELKAGVLVPAKQQDGDPGDGLSRRARQLWQLIGECTRVPLVHPTTGETGCAVSDRELRAKFYRPSATSDANRRAFYDALEDLIKHNLLARIDRSQIWAKLDVSA